MIPPQRLLQESYQATTPRLPTSMFRGPYHERWVALALSWAWRGSSTARLDGQHRSLPEGGGGRAGGPGESIPLWVLRALCCWTSGLPMFTIPYPPPPHLSDFGRRWGGSSCVASQLGPLECSFKSVSRSPSGKHVSVAVFHVPGSPFRKCSMVACCFKKHFAMVPS